MSVPAMGDVTGRARPAAELATEVTRLPLHDYSGSAQGPQRRNRRMNRVREYMSE